MPKIEAIAAAAAALPIAAPEERTELAMLLIDAAVSPGPSWAPQSATSVDIARAGRWSQRISRWWYGRWRPAVSAADEALVKVLAHWSDLPDACKPAAIAAGVGRWSVAVQRVLLEGGESGRVSLARAAGDSAEPALVAELATLLLSAEEAVVIAAESALQSDAIVRTERGRGAIVAAMRTYAEHRRRGVARAAVRALAVEPRPPAKRGTATSELQTWLAEATVGATDHERDGAAAVRSVIRRDGGPGASVDALRLCVRREVAASAVDRLARLVTDGERDEVIAASHLALVPARAAQLSSLRARPPRSRGATKTAEPGPLPAPDTIEAMSLEARRGLPRWVGALECDLEGTRAVLEPLLADADAVVRLAAVRVLPPRAIAEFCLDQDERVARSAALSWSMIGAMPGLRAPARALGDPERVRMARVLMRSPVSAVRTVAGEELADPFDAASGRGMVLARRMLAADRERYIGELRARLETVGSGAIGVVRRLGIAREFEAELTAIVRRENEADAASAVSALGGVRTPAAQEAVRAAAAHPDPRVRSNAIEAAAKQRSALFGAVLAEVKGDRHHRVRATAMRESVRSGSDRSSAGGLWGMLLDPLPTNRAAGLWAVERLAGFIAGESGWHSAASTVGASWDRVLNRAMELRTGDDDPRVRRRAHGAAVALVGAARVGAGVLGGSRALWRDESAADGEAGGVA